MSSSYWKFGNGFTTVSNITTMLENASSSQSSKKKEGEVNGIKLVNLLDESDLLQEVSTNNTLLLEYLRDPKVMEMLVDLVINDYEGATDEDLNHPDTNESDTTLENSITDFNNEGKDTNSMEVKDATEEKGKGKEVEQQKAEDKQNEEDEEDEEADKQNDNKIENDNDEDEEDTEIVQYIEKDSPPVNHESGSEEGSDSEEDSFDNNDMSSITTETPQEAHTRRASIAAEILSADVWSLTDTLMENISLIEKLWDVLDMPAPLPINLATYFMKINEHLLDMKMDEMIQFILNQPTLVARFMRHIDNPPLMDFLLKVISTDKPDSSTGVIDILQHQKLIPELISFLAPEVPSYIQSAAGDFIKAFVTISANSNTENSTIGPNELTRELVSEPIVRELVRLMLKGGTGLGNGVGIVIEIIRKNNSDYDIVPVLYITIASHPPSGRDPIYLGTLLNVFNDAIPEFTKMLEHSEGRVLETPFGSIEPLGFERFKICELIAELLHCSNMGLLNDEKGEEIVKERDAERERLKNLRKAAFEFSYPIGDDTTNSNLDDEASNENDDQSKVESNTENDDVVSENLNNLTIDESTEDDTIAAFSNDNKEGSDTDSYENLLRQNPVVGDKLKIALVDNNVLITILEMFFRFPWNNFLHNVVFDIVQQVLNGSMDTGYNKYLAIDIFGRGDVTRLIIEGQLKCDEYEESTGLRYAYMGHLTLIAEEVVKFIQLYSIGTISTVIDEAVSTEHWEQYVSETLYETREKYNAILGGVGSYTDKVDPDSDILSNNMADSNMDHDLNSAQFLDNTQIRHDSVDDYDDDDYDNDYLKDPEQQQEEGNEENMSNNYLEQHGQLDFGVHSRSSQPISENDLDDAEVDNDGDGDQFSRYMSQQITNDLPNKFGSSDEDEEEEDLVAWNYQYSKHNSPLGNTSTNSKNSNQLSSALPNLGSISHDEDDDDYVDPNDDGLSYAKPNHPLYNNDGILSNDIDSYKNHHRSGYSEPFSDGEDDNNDEQEQEDLGLTRSKSKGEMNWDNEEQDRILKMADFIQHHQS